MPRRCCSARISRRISPRSWASRLESGSSIRQTGVSATMARPSATRCCWPPDSCDGLRSSSRSRPSMEAARLSRASRSARGTRRTLSPKTMFSRNRQVGKQRVGLEHHRGSAPRRGELRHVAAADLDRAGIRALQPGDQPQRGRLAATRRTEQHHQAARFGREADPVDRGLATPALGHFVQPNLRHAAPLRDAIGAVLSYYAQSAGQSKAAHLAAVLVRHRCRWRALPVKVSNGTTADRDRRRPGPKPARGAVLRPATRLDLRGDTACCAERSWALPQLRCLSIF